MRKTVSLIVLVTSLLLAGGAPGQGTSPAASGTAEKILARRVTDDRQNDVPSVSALTVALSTARVPGGIALAEACGGQPRPISLSARSSLRDVLDVFVRANPEYKWESDRGVINLTPAAGAPPLLDIRLARFRLQKVGSLGVALGRLLATPEVREGMTELNVQQGVLRVSGPGYYSPPGDRGGAGVRKLEVGGVNLTVREALNAIVRAHGRAVWLYSENPCGGRREFSIDFPVQ